VAELRRRLDIRRDDAVGNVVVGVVLDYSTNPFTEPAAWSSSKHSLRPDKDDEHYPECLR